MPRHFSEIAQLHDDLRAIRSDVSPAKVSIKIITPAKAAKLLEENFELNRDLDPDKVKKYASEMRNNVFVLSNDAICADVNGKLINGQHRLHAIIKTGLGQEFIFLENIPTENIKKMDIAKKRNRHGRLKADGKIIPTIGCIHILEAALCSYMGKAVGSSQLAAHSHDNKIFDAYKNHYEFINLLEKRGLARGSAIGAAALYMYAHMMQHYHELPNTTDTYPHLQSPVERAVGFVEICKQGYSRSLSVRAQYDMPALGMYQRSQTKEWMCLNSQEKLRWYMSAAFIYMRGNSEEVEKPYDGSPFNFFDTYPATSDW